MRNKIFMFSIILIIFVISVVTLVLPEREISLEENRALTKFPEFSYQSFMDGSFQSNYEKALQDQLFTSEINKRAFNYYKRNLTLASYNLLYAMNKNKEERREVDKSNKQVEDFIVSLIPRAEGIFEFKDSKHLIVIVWQQDKYRDYLKERIHDIYLESQKSKKKDVEYYYYYMEGVRDIDFINQKIYHLYSDLLQEEFNKFGKSKAFELHSSDDYRNYYYKTDHHWNEKGQKLGYREILNLLFEGEEKPLDINTIKLEGIEFVGSRGRTINDFSYWDEFYINDADIPEYDYYINLKKVERIGLDLYKNNKADGSRKINHYVECFGMDKGLKVFDFKDESKDNLLVIGNSAFNPINHLISSHFNKTYIVDLRHYEREVGKNFVMNEFIEEYDIDKVLYIGSGTDFIFD